MKRIFLLFIFALSTHCAAEDKISTKSLTTSIIIPCSHAHFFILHELLTHLNHQTKTPTEVVVSLSGCKQLDSDEIALLEKLPWRFRLKIIKNQENLKAGKNRNLASEASIGEILIYQDADDLPHFQRVEIIEHLFRTQKIDHILHLWQGIEPFEKYQLNDLDIESIFSYDEIAKSTLNIHNGNIAISRRVLEKVSWHPTKAPGQDILFNQEIFRNSYKTILVKSPLIAYRPLSALTQSAFRGSFQDVYRIFGIAHKSKQFGHLKRCVKRYGNTLKSKNGFYSVFNAIKSLFQISDWQKARANFIPMASKIIQERLGKELSEADLSQKSMNLSEFILRYLIDQNSSTRTEYLTISTWDKLNNAESKRILDWMIDRAMFGDGKSLEDLSRNQLIVLINQEIKNYKKTLARAQRVVAKSSSDYRQSKLESKSLKGFLQLFGTHLSVLDSLEYLVDKQGKHFLEDVSTKMQMIDKFDLEKLEELLVEMRDQTRFLSQLLKKVA